MRSQPAQELQLASNFGNTRPLLDGLESASLATLHLPLLAFLWAIITADQGQGRSTLVLELHKRCKLSGCSS